MSKSEGERVRERERAGREGVSRTVSEKKKKRNR
jgi:hypothetical protein